jgi:3-dehydroquinate synthetase
MAEVIKHAIIGDGELFDALFSLPHAGGAPEAGLIELIARAIRVKVQLVKADPFEQNVRAQLNLGHTFGHALEQLSRYRLRHGYAVAAGIAVAARLACQLGLCDAATRDRILSQLSRHGLPIHIPGEWGAAQILDAMRTDKKVRDGQLRLVLPLSIGRVEVVDGVAAGEIQAALAESQVPGTSI